MEITCAYVEDHLSDDPHSKNASWQCAWKEVEVVVPVRVDVCVLSIKVNFERSNTLLLVRTARIGNKYSKVDGTRNTYSISLKSGLSSSVIMRTAPLRANTS